VPTPWVAVSWIAFAIALVLLSRKLNYAQLAWQANAVAILASLRTLNFNYDLDQKIWIAISLRIVTVVIVAAGLYCLSRQAAPDLRTKAAVAFVHSFSATGLLALLAWHEAPNGWLAPLWAGFALVLALVDSRFALAELRWQAYILSFLALARGVVFNLHLTATWRDLSVRLLSLALVAVFFYTMSRVVRMPEQWRARDLQHAYSWAASTIVSLLISRLGGVWAGAVCVWDAAQRRPIPVSIVRGATGQLRANLFREPDGRRPRTFLEPAHLHHPATGADLLFCVPAVHAGGRHAHQNRRPWRRKLHCRGARDLGHGHACGAVLFPVSD